MGLSEPANRSTWPPLAGGVLTFGVALVADLLQRLLPERPIAGLGVLLIACVILSVLRGGWKSGAASGVVAVAAYAWLQTRGTWHFGPRLATRVAIELAVIVPVVLALGRLVLRLEQTAQRERALRRRAVAERVRADWILESIGDGFFAIDRQWRYVYVNAKAERLVGRPRKELIGSSLWDAFPPLVGSRWDREYRRALETGDAVHFEEYYPPLDAWFETHAYPSANGLSIFLRDVTDRVRAEQALRSRVLQQGAIAHVGQLGLRSPYEGNIQSLLDEAVARLAAVFDVELAKVLERLPDGKLLLRAGVGWKPGRVGSALVEPETESQAGYTLLTQHPVIVDDLRTERRFHGPRLLIEHNVLSGMSVVISGRDGAYGILAVHSTRTRTFTADDASFLAGMAHVLALAIERERATARLVENEQRFRQLAENIHDVLFITDVRNEEPTYVNAAYESVWGRSVASWYENPLSWLDAVHSDDRPRVEAATAGLADGHYDEQFRIVRPDGEVRWIHDRAFGVRDERGRIRRVVGIAEDFTDKRRLSEEHAARAAAEARAAARDEVLAVVSHDLRSPLSAIDLAAAGIDRCAVPGQSRYLEIIRRSTRQMTRLITDLLDVTRIDAGAGLAITRMDVDPRALLQNLLERSSLQAESRGVELVVSCPSELGHVFADGDRLLQALENLVGNAIKFTPPGGRIWVQASMDEQRLRFAVSDTGPGVPADSASKLFERYWQARADRRGIGLGLPIVKGIADAHRGRVWVEARPGGGSTFKVEIPLPWEPQPETQPVEQLSPPREAKVARDVAPVAARDASSGTSAKARHD